MYPHAADNLLFPRVVDNDFAFTDDPVRNRAGFGVLVNDAMPENISIVGEQLARTGAVLFHGDGFCEVARLVHVAATTNGNVVSKQLQRDDLNEWREQLECRRDVDDVLHH